MQSRPFVVLALASLTGCLGNEVSGRWVAACQPGDEVYVELKHSTEGAEYAEYFDCTRYGFSIGTTLNSFRLTVAWLRDRKRISVQTRTFDDVIADLDVGTIRL